MQFPTKKYDRLLSLQDRWGISQEDLFYAVENGLLRVCVWLPLRYVERGIIKKKKFIFETQEHREGFVCVRPGDCRRICSTGRGKLRIFRSVTDDTHMIRLAYEPPQPALCVRLSELVVLQQDRARFEESHDIQESNVIELHPEDSEPEFSASDDYRYVRMSGEDFHLGDVQARVLEQLHDAAQSHKPWVHGKTLIYESGSNALRVRDIFKNKKNWRKLITSNERGYYRLNIPIDHAALSKAAAPSKSSKSAIN